ncbi:MAG: PAS domain-containing protein [Halothiobacillaceae bacterium]
MRQIVESPPSPMVMRRAEDGLLIEINEAAAQSVGFSRAELLGTRTVDFYVDPDEREALMAILRSQRIARQHELRVRHRDGHPAPSGPVRPARWGGVRRAADGYR